MKKIRIRWFLMTLMLLFITGCSVGTAKVDPITYRKIEGMPLTILAAPVDNRLANWYIVYDPNTLDAVLIDSGTQAEKIISLVKEYKLTLHKIILTHWHGDHTLTAGDVKSATGAEIMIHKNDQSSLQGVTADRLLMAGEQIKVGGQALTVAFTPGHTAGGITLVGPGMAFTGDTLFSDGVGNTREPGGDQEQLGNSLRYLLTNLPPETRIFPGHKIDSTIGAQRDKYRDALGL
jgi:hydroxyacylglutathione hydrolase